MITIENNIDLTDFKTVDSFDQIENNDKILFNKKITLHHDLINNGIIATGYSIEFSGGRLINNGQILLIGNTEHEFIIDFDITTDSAFTGIELDGSNMEYRLIICGPSGSHLKWSKVIESNGGKNFYFQGNKLFFNAIQSGIEIYKNYKIIIQVL